MLRLGQTLLDGAESASLDEIRSAIRTLATGNHVIAEGAGACPVAVALAQKVEGNRIVCVVSGGNVDIPVLRELLA